MLVSLLNFNDWYFLWRDIITWYDVTWKREKLNSWSILKKKGDIWTSAEGRVQDANSEKTVTGENKYTGRVIVWGNCKNAEKFMNYSWCLGWLLGNEDKVRKTLILSLWVALWRFCHHETCCEIICQGVVVLMRILFTAVMNEIR